MNRNGIVIVVVALVVIVAGGIIWQQQSATAPEHGLAKVRPSDTTTAIGIPESPHLVIANELVVQLKEGETVEKFTQSLTGGGVKVIGWIPSLRIVQVEVPAAEREARKAELEANPLVLSIIYQQVFKKNARLNDPVFTNENPRDDWNLRAINAEAAWDITRGSPEIIIAIIDGGVLVDHEELKGKIVRPSSIFSKDKKSMAGTGDDLLHGTHVAIIAAGTGDNGVGTSGVCPNCRVMPVQVGLHDNATTTTVLAGIDYAVRNGAKVINVSMAPEFKDSPDRFIDKKRRYSELLQMTRRFRQRMADIGNIFSIVESRGVVVVVGAGNDNMPGDFNNLCQSGFTICVGNAASRKDGSLATRVSSNYGFAVRVAAPGSNIFSGIATAGGKGYASASGTSMSSPHVAGLAGLILSANSAMKPHEVRAAILASGYANNKNRNDGTRWSRNFRYAHRNMEIWRRAFLRLLGKDENKLLDGPGQSLLAVMIPPAKNNVWGWPYDTTGGKGNGDKVIGRFIDAREALEMAASGAYRDRITGFTKADIAKVPTIDRNVLVRLHDMLWYEGHFTAPKNLGGGFSLVANPPYDRLTVIRDIDPGNGYEEWFDYRSANIFQHHARHDGKNYSQGKVELLLRKDRLKVTPKKSNEEIIYDPK
jgi:hypothetical protein